MAISRFQRSPLGSFHRSPLGVRGGKNMLILYIAADEAYFGSEGQALFEEDLNELMSLPLAKHWDIGLVNVQLREDGYFNSRWDELLRSIEDDRFNYTPSGVMTPWRLLDIQVHPQFWEDTDRNVVLMLFQSEMRIFPTPFSNLTAGAIGTYRQDRGERNTGDNYKRSLYDLPGRGDTLGREDDISRGLDIAPVGLVNFPSNPTKDDFIEAFDNLRDGRYPDRIFLVADINNPPPPAEPFSVAEYQAFIEYLEKEYPGSLESLTKGSELIKEDMGRIFAVPIFHVPQFSEAGLVYEREVNAGKKVLKHFGVPGRLWIRAQANSLTDPATAGGSNAVREGAREFRDYVKKSHSGTKVNYNVFGNVHNTVAQRWVRYAKEQIQENS